MLTHRPEEFGRHAIVAANSRSVVAQGGVLTGLEDKLHADMLVMRGISMTEGSRALPSEV